MCVHLQLSSLSQPVSSVMRDYLSSCLIPVSLNQSSLHLRPRSSTRHPSDVGMVVQWVELQPHIFRSELCFLSEECGLFMSVVVCFCFYISFTCGLVALNLLQGVYKVQLPTWSVHRHWTSKVDTEDPDWLNKWREKERKTSRTLTYFFPQLWICDMMLLCSQTAFQPTELFI